MTASSTGFWMFMTTVIVESFHLLPTGFSCNIHRIVNFARQIVSMGDCILTQVGHIIILAIHALNSAKQSRFIPSFTADFSCNIQRIANFAYHFADIGDCI